MQPEADTKLYIGNWRTQVINPLPNNKISDHSNLKAFADDEEDLNGKI